MTARRSRRVTLRVVSTDDDNPIGEARPIVRIVAGKRPEAIEAAEEHLVARDLELFQRGQSVVRAAPQEVEVAGGGKAEVLRIVPVKTQHMRDRFNLAVDLRRFDKRIAGGRPDCDDAWVSIDCPPAFADAYLERFGFWKLPILRAVITAPTMRPDGSIIDKPGFDRASGIYFDPCGAELPPVPRAPTKALAREALDRLESLIGGFPFIDEAARSAALAGLIGPVVRAALDAAPLIAVTAPVARSGKSKLVNTAAILATGHPAPKIALGSRDEECEKALKATLLAGDLMPCIDNIDRPLGGDLLCQMITEPHVDVRLFGTLASERLPNKACLYATGNNLQLLGDLTRRALVCALDAKCERPELREFETADPCETARRERPELVVAILSLVRAFLLEGAPRSTVPIGSFEAWCRFVRDPLIWLGRADPAATMETARGSDPRLAALRTVLAQWHQRFGEDRVTAQQVIGAASDGFNPEFREALLNVAGERGAINSRRLGKWLAAVAGRPITFDVGGDRFTRMLCRAGARFGVVLWQVGPC